jgi:hypothetical protein
MKPGIMWQDRFVDHFPREGHWTATLEKAVQIFSPGIWFVKMEEVCLEIANDTHNVITGMTVNNGRLETTRRRRDCTPKVDIALALRATKNSVDVDCHHAFLLAAEPSSEEKD